MVPSKENPKWRDVLERELTTPLNSFALKMLVTRLRSEVKRDPATLPNSIDELHSFFVRNEEIAREDLKRLF